MKSTPAPNRPYAWMPPEVGDAFLYTPIATAPIMWAAVMVWDFAADGILSDPFEFWLLAVVIVGIPLNYVALIVLGIPACRFLLGLRTESAFLFVLTGAIAGMIVSLLWLGTFGAGWVGVGAVIGGWNGNLVWRAARRARRRSSQPSSDEVPWRQHHTESSDPIS